MKPKQSLKFEANTAWIYIRKKSLTGTANVQLGDQLQHAWECFKERFEMSSIAIAKSK